MKTLIVLISTALIAGCNSNPSIDLAIAEHNVELNRYAMEQNAKPLFSMKCPVSGCVISELEIRHPDQIKPTPMKMPTNGWDALTATSKALVELVGDVMPYYGMMHLGVSGIENAGQNTNGSYNLSDAYKNDYSGDVSGSFTVGQ